MLVKQEFIYCVISTALFLHVALEDGKILSDSWTAARCRQVGGVGVGSSSRKLPLCDLDFYVFLHSWAWNPEPCACSTPSPELFLLSVNIRGFLDRSSLTPKC